jgi:hypothetical protein
MSDPSSFGFGPFVPGFDFLQSLSKRASQAQPAVVGGMPSMASWVVPTLSIEEIDKRIQTLKSALFWLEQNTTALKASIQAMEVQKMTLSTLQSMNVDVADLAKVFMPEPISDAQPESASNKPGGPKAAVDPAQWWTALTQQFQGIAAAALKDVTSEATQPSMAAKAAESGKAPTARKSAVKIATTVHQKPKTKPKSKPLPRPSASK